MDKEKLIVGVLATAGTVATVFATFFGVKLNGIAKKYDKTIKNLSELTEVDISDEMIKMATDKAVGAAVGERAKKVAESITGRLDKEITSQVSDAVKDAKAGIKDSVTKEIKSQVANISISDLRDEVKEEAKENIMERLDSDMDDIREMYTKQLENQGKIYTSIADMMSGKAKDSGKNINLNL